MELDFETNTVEELCKGYRETPEGAYQCLLCMECFTPGEVYPMGERFFTAQRAVERHVTQEHPDRFTQMLMAQSKYITLTQNQKELLSLIHAGLSDRQIAQRLEVTPSTIRRQKFTFREKAKQARAYLALFELAMGDGSGAEDTPVPVHTGATMVDSRYQMTRAEEQKILESAFFCLDPLRLRVFSAKEKKKIVILRRIAQQFVPGRRYTEAEINEVLQAIYGDYVTLRRYLIEYGFMKRTRDGREYWLSRQEGGGTQPG